jgi:hypothetical protein
MEKINLYKCEYLTGCLETIDTQSISQMVLERYYAKRNMSTDETSIRNEDIRIEFNSDIQNLARELCEVWREAYDQNIELCWNSTMVDADPNEAAWAVVHEKGAQTNLHSHESPENYLTGAHVSAAYWVKIPENSGDFVFQYRPNPYIVQQKTIKPQVGHYAMFDSTLQHFVTRNLSNDLRIVISMNFRINENI